MPPRPNNVDGIYRPPTVPLGDPPTAPPATAGSPNPKPAIDRPAEAKPPADSSSAPVKNHPVKVSKIAHGQAIPILITLIVMVLLIGLAYLAYTKSK